jgi:hypothetical protein
MVCGILDASTVARETAGGYSSLSEIPRVLKAGSLNMQRSGILRADVEQAGETVYKSDKINLIEKFKSLDIFDIDEGGKTRRVAFGNIPPRAKIESTKDMPEIIPMSPFDISGLSRQSKEGQQVAYDYAHALAATDLYSDNTGIQAGAHTASQVNALLYAGSRGDDTAMAEFQKMVEIGKERVAVERAKLFAPPGINEDTPGPRMDPTIKILPRSVRPGSEEHDFILETEGQAKIDMRRQNYENSTRSIY